MSADLRAGGHPSAVGRYQVLAHLGGTALEDVYRGFDPLIERPVVLRVFRFPSGTAAQQTAAREAFYAEMQRTGELVHPGIATIYDAGEAAGSLFVAAEFVEGRRIGDLLTLETGMTLALRAALFTQVADALEYAHDVGVPHLGLQPDAIVVADDYSVKVGNFGVAPVLDLVAASAAVSPPVSRYTAPERLRGAQGDARSDVFSLAQLALDLLTVVDGRQPDGTTAMPQRWMDHGVRSDGWDEVFTRALTDDPDRRTATPDAFKADLLALIGIRELEARLAWDTSRSMGGLTLGQIGSGVRAGEPAPDRTRMLDETMLASDVQDTAVTSTTDAGIDMTTSELSTRLAADAGRRGEH